MADSFVTHEFQSRFAPAERLGEIGRLAGYSIQKLLSAGGMGEVYEAEDVALNRPVALKIMLDDIAMRPEARARFLREARSAAAVVHDHIVRIYQVGEDRGLLFIAMELLRGESLAAVLQRPPPDAAMIRRIAAEACAGLAAAHEAGLVHRDIKPANLWLEAGTGRVKILDFGLARSNADGTLTNTGQIFGTPAYISPEQASGRPVDHRADLFSLGSVLYELATGQRAFRGDNILAMLNSLANDSPPPPHELNPALPPALSNLIMRLIEKDPLERPPTAAEASRMLTRIPDRSAGLPVARPVQDMDRGWMPTFRRQRLLGMLREADDALRRLELRRIAFSHLVVVAAILLIAVAFASDMAYRRPTHTSLNAEFEAGYFVGILCGIFAPATVLYLLLYLWQMRRRYRWVCDRLRQEFPDEMSGGGAVGALEPFIVRSMLEFVQRTDFVNYGERGAGQDPSQLSRGSA